MNICLITPAPRASRAGNRASANRWSAILRKLGHSVTVDTDYRGEMADLMVALHAWRSADAIAAFHARLPDRPLVVVLTGTDAYRFLHSHPETTLASLEAANYIVGLHPLVGSTLPQHLREKLRIIIQSARPLKQRKPFKRGFRVCFAGHLREEKDPLCIAHAVRNLPASSGILVDAYGIAHSQEWADAARKEMALNPRYRWHGEIAHPQLRRIYSRSHLLVLPSLMEGGGNVVSEAVMAGLPVIASDIEGSVGLLGEDYPGYFPVQDIKALRDRLLRAESDAAYYAALQAGCRARQHLFEPAQEQAGWAALVNEVQASVNA